MSSNQRKEIHRKHLLSTAVWPAIGAFLLLPAVSFATEVRAYSVAGMVCGLCAKGIEKKLLAVNGVGGVKVDLDQLTVTVTLADGKENVPESDLVSAIEAAGYKPKKIEAKK